MANISVTQLTTLATMVAAEALGKLKSNTVLARIINRNYDSVIASQGQVVKIPFRGALTVNDKAVQTAVTLQNPADTSVNVTLNKHKEVSFLVEDPAAAMASYEILRGYMGDSVLGIAETIDGDIAALYASFSQSIDGSAGMGEAIFREGQRKLNAAKAPLMQRFAVLHEDAYAEAQAIEKLINKDYQGDAAEEAVRMGYLGFLNGFNILLDQNIKTATTHKNLFLHRDAAVLVSRPLPVADPSMGVTQVTLSEDGVSLRVTMSYSPQYLGMQCTVDTLYGVAELRDAFGVVVTSTPAS